jgi:phospholysine phosphohistidine inorganic pyrophosphate phosphatase
MVGDDVMSDVGGAQAAGIRGVLVRSGKYTPADEIQTAVRPVLVLDNLAALVDIILA